jgi:hypothetical protein
LATIGRSAILDEMKAEMKTQGKGQYFEAREYRQ